MAARASGVVAAGSWAFAALGGTLLGAALQLQQARMWSAGAYAALFLAGLAGLAVLSGRWRPRFQRPHAGRMLTWLPMIAALACGTFAGSGLAGWRAAAYAKGALDPALEGRDLQVVGVVAQMPQRNEGGTRFRLDVESARWADESRASPPRVPARIALGWYHDDTGLWGRAPEGRSAAKREEAAPLHAGDRWRLTVRLKAPHGNLNPHGFDSELWL